MGDLSKELRAQANQHPLDADLLMFDVAASQIEALEQERDELAARVGRMEAAAAPAANELSELIEEIQSEWSKNSCKREVETLNQLRDMLKESPAESLLLHDAGVLDRFKDKLFIPHPRQCSYSQGYNKAMRSVLDELNEGAADLRKQAAEQESK
jgi:hypothetical protein